MKKSFGIIAIGFFCLFFSNVSATESPAFDCAKASTKVGKTICGSKTLSALDRTLDTAWKGLLELNSDKMIKEDERRWIKQRDSECKWGADEKEITACLSGYYKSRIGALTEAIIASDFAVCTNEDLRLHYFGSDAGMSHRVVYVGLENISKKQCVLSGWPTVSSPSGFGVDKVFQSYAVSTKSTLPAGLNPGVSAWFSVNWTTCGPCDGCIALKEPGLAFGAPGGKPAWKIDALKGIKTCDMGKGGGVTITPIVIGGKHP